MRTINHKPAEHDVWMIYTNKHTPSAVCDSWKAVIEWMMLNETESYRQWKEIHRDDLSHQIHRFKGGSETGNIFIHRMPVYTSK